MEQYFELMSNGVMLCGICMLFSLLSKWIFAIADEYRDNTIKQLKEDLKAKEDTITLLRACINNNKEV